MSLIEKIRSLLGLHVCDWSKWEPFEVAIVRAPSVDEATLGGLYDKMVRETKRWQRRKCKACGYTQERKL